MKKPTQNLSIAIIATLCFMQSLHAQSFQGPARGMSESAVIVFPPKYATLKSEVALPLQSHARGFFTAQQLNPSKPAINQFTFGGRYSTPFPTVTSDSIRASADFAGIPATGWPRPDPTLAVGPQHVILAVNSTLAVYDKVGEQCFKTDLADFFAGMPAMPVIHEPRLFYDHFHERWMLLALAGSTTRATAILVAVSSASDPKAFWRAWQLNAQVNGFDSIPYYAADLNVGFDSNGLIIAINHLNSNDNFVYAKIRVLELAQFDQDQSLTWWDFWALKDSEAKLARALAPARAQTSDTLAYLMNTKIESFDSADKLQLWRLKHAAIDTPRLSSKSYRLQTYYPPAPARQPSGPALDAGDARIANAVYQNGKLYGVQTVGTEPPDDFAGGSSFQIINVTLSPVEQDTVKSLILVDRHGSWLWGSSLAVDQDGRLAVAQNIASDSLAIFPSLFAQVLPAPEQPLPLPVLNQYCKLGTTPFTSLYSPAPWGRACDIKIDPDGSTFWLYGPYAGQDSIHGWATHVCAISLEQPDLYPLQLVAPFHLMPGKSYSGTLRFLNQGQAFTGKFSHQLYFSWDSLLQVPNDVPILLPEPLLQRGLNANETADSVITFMLPDTLQKLQGSAYLLYHIDAAGQVKESNESNNIRMRKITLIEALTCSLSIQSPDANEFVCGDGIEVIAVARFSGGLGARIESATINGIAATIRNDTLNATVPLSPGANIISARVSIVDTLGNRALSADSVNAFSDLSPPTCTLDFNNLPVITGEIRDHESGIAAVAIVAAINRQVTIDTFVVGDTLVHFTSNKIVPNQVSWFNFKIANRAGCEMFCDPAYVRLEPSRSLGRFAFELAPGDRYLLGNNHGLQHITILLNEHELHFIARDLSFGREGNRFFIPRDGRFSLEIGEYLEAGQNTAEITCEGGEGSYADLVFSDVRAPSDSTATQDVSNPLPLPTVFALKQNYPNPFNPETRIPIEVPPGWNARISLRIINLHGQLVRTLLEGATMPAGRHEAIWNGKDSQGLPVSSGIYFYLLKSANNVAVKKMLLAR